MIQDDNKIVCPDCATEIQKVEGMAVGDILECQECGTEVEVTSMEPLTFRELIEEK